VISSVTFPGATAIFCLSRADINAAMQDLGVSGPGGLRHVIDMRVLPGYDTNSFHE